MAVALPDLESALAELGDAFVLVGDPFTAGGLVPLGAKEGEATVDFQDEYREATYPDQTGPAVHARVLAGSNPRVTLPMVIGDAALYRTLSPTGDASGGYTTPQRVAETSLVLVSMTDFGAGPWSYDGVTWAPAAPVASFFFWRVHFERPGITYRSADAGKIVQEVPVQVMHYTANPNGHKLWTHALDIAEVPGVRI